METTEPLVSIIIPTYNMGHWIGEAIGSALAQTYSHCEIIVVDDGSTDGTGEFLRECYGDRIRYVYQDNKGRGAARNHGLRLARGGYVQFLDADDLILPAKIATHVAFLEAHPEYAAVYCHALVFYEDDPDHPWDHARQDAYCSGEILETEIHEPFLLPVMVLVRQVWVDKVGGFAGLRAALPPDFFHMIKPMNHGVYPWTGTTIGIVILGIWYWCSDQVIVQRALSAKSLAHARGGTLLTAFLKILPLFIFVLPGLIAAVLWKSEIAADPDMAYPLIVTRLLPQGIAGIMIAALLAALMSSLSSVFNSCSTLITMDVYRKFKPDASERKLVTIGRLSTAAVVIVSLIWIPMIRYLSDQLYQYLQSIQAYIGAPVTAVFLVGILWKRATGKAALTTMITGSVLGMIRFATDILSKMGYTNFGPFNLLTGYAFLNYSVLMFAFCTILMIVLSLLMKKPETIQLTDLTFSRKTMSVGVEKTWVWVHIILSLLAVSIIASIWIHFA